MISYRSFPTAEAPPETLVAIRRLLDAAFDGEFSDEDWHNGLGGDHVAAFAGEVVVAHGAVVPRTLEVAGRRIDTGYVEAVATASSRRGGGIGTGLMRSINEIITTGHEMGALATGAHAFYERVGWERWRGTTWVRTGDTVHRSPDDDDAIMVLRFGRTADIDLTAAITCEARPGDD